METRKITVTSRSKKVVRMPVKKPLGCHNCPLSYEHREMEQGVGYVSYTLCSAGFNERVYGYLTNGYFSCGFYDENGLLKLNDGDVYERKEDKNC